MNKKLLAMLPAMSSEEALSKLRAEEGTPSADLWFGGCTDAFMSAKDDGLLEQVKFNEAKYLADDCEYAGEIVMSSSAVSGTNYALVNALLQSMDKEKGWEYLESLNNNTAYYGKRGSNPLNRVSAGKSAIGISYIYIDRSVQAKAEESVLTIAYPTDGIPLVPEGVALFKNSENTGTAIHSVEWLFSSDENPKMPADMEKKDAIKVIKPSLKGNDLSFDTASLMKEDMSPNGSQGTSILEKFEPVMGGKAAYE